MPCLRTRVAAQVTQGSLLAWRPPELELLCVAMQEMLAHAADSDDASTSASTSTSSSSSSSSNSSSSSTSGTSGAAQGSATALALPPLRWVELLAERREQLLADRTMRRHLRLQLVVLLNMLRRAWQRQLAAGGGGAGGEGEGVQGRVAALGPAAPAAQQEQQRVASSAKEQGARKEAASRQVPAGPTQRQWRVAAGGGREKTEAASQGAAAAPAQQQRHLASSGRDKGEHKAAAGPRAAAAPTQRQQEQPLEQRQDHQQRQQQRQDHQRRQQQRPAQQVGQGQEAQPGQQEAVPAGWRRRTGTANGVTGVRRPGSKQVGGEADVAARRQRAAVAINGQDT